MPTAARSAEIADVVVVGAGPAGVAAATTLARAGRRVVVVDRARFPRDKVCGDGLTAGALRLLEQLGLDPATVPSFTPVHDVWLSGPARHVVRFPLPRDEGLFAAVARRSELDAALVDLARAAGVTVREGQPITSVTAAGDETVVVAGDRTVRARFVVAADGMWSPTRKLLGLAAPAYRGDWHAFRQYFTDVGPRAASELWVWFEPDFLPGYCWSFPVAGGANVGFGIQRGGSWEVGDMAHLWRDLLARPAVRAVLGEQARPEGPHRAWPIPARAGDLPLTGPRTLFVGDAAAAADPMTGEGIGQALATGVWAAEALLAAGPADPARAAALYERRVRRALVVDHAMSNLLVRALQHRKGARAAIRVAGLTDWTRRNFARWLFEDYPRSVLLTPDRWHRGMLAGSGAYSARPWPTPS